MSNFARLVTSQAFTIAGRVLTIVCLMHIIFIISKSPFFNESSTSCNYFFTLCIKLTSTASL